MASDQEVCCVATGSGCAELLRLINRSKLASFLPAAFCRACPDAPRTGRSDSVSRGDVTTLAAFREGGVMCGVVFRADVTPALLLELSFRGELLGLDAVTSSFLNGVLPIFPSFVDK